MKSQGVIIIALIMRFIMKKNIKKDPMPRLVNMVELQTKPFHRSYMLCQIQTSKMFLKSIIF